MRTPVDYLQSFRENKHNDNSKFSTLCLAETALGEGDEISLKILSSKLTPAQASILAITEARVSQSDPWRGALLLSRAPESRDRSHGRRGRVFSGQRPLAPSGGALASPT